MKTKQNGISKMINACLDCRYSVTKKLLKLICMAMFLCGYSTASLAAPVSGQVWVWGWGVNPSIIDEAAPLPVSLSGASAVAEGHHHGLAVKTDGTVWSWGVNSAGQLGDGTFTDRLIPSQINGLAGVTAVAGGYRHSLALKSDGTVWAWGSNYLGTLGNGTFVDAFRTAIEYPAHMAVPIPVPVIGLSNVTAIAAGIGNGLALKSDGTVWSWGINNCDNPYDIWGLGTTSDRATQSQVSGLTDVIAIASGTSHYLALKADGTVWAWGYNGYLQLGDGTNIDRQNPEQVGGLNGVVAISAGAFHSLALKADGTVWVWGNNASGAARVGGLSAVVAISAGYGHSKALNPDCPLEQFREQ